MSDQREGGSSELRDAAAGLLGLSAEGTFTAWGNCDKTVFEDAIAAAHKMGLARESLAMELWRLSRSNEGFSARALHWSVALGEAEIARRLFATADQAGESHADQQLEMAKLEAALGRGEAALEILREVPVRGLGWQIAWAEALLIARAPDAGDMLRMVLAKDLSERRSRAVPILLEVARLSSIFANNPWLVEHVLEQCTAKNLPYLLAVLAESECLADLPDSVLDRLAAGEPESTFWRAALRMAKTRDIRETAKALNFVYGEHALGGVSFSDSPGNALGRITATPSTSGTASNALVSVVVCAHDAEETIGYSLRSIASQTHRNLEIIVVDDHSSHPVRLSEDWHMGRPITLHRNDVNLGPYQSRNVGLSLAKGQVISFHDADDWAHPDKIAHQLREMDAHAAVAHYGAHVRLRPTGDLQPENNGLFIGDGPITGVFRRSVFEACGKFANTRTRGDIEFRRRLESPAKRQKVISLAVPYVLALHWHSNSRRMVDSLKKRLAMRDFLARSAKMSHMLSFSAAPEKAERIYDSVLDW